MPLCCTPISCGLLGPHPPSPGAELNPSPESQELSGLIMNNPPDTNQSPCIRVRREAGPSQQHRDAPPTPPGTEGVSADTQPWAPQGPQLASNTNSPSGSDAFWAQPG